MDRSKFNTDPAIRAKSGASDDFDAAAKEQALQQEAASWDTSLPVAAEPGDIPLVDVGPWFETGDREALIEAAAALRDASVRVGFHQLIGHGVSGDEIDAMFALNRTFHALPDEAKQPILMDRPGHPLGGSGWLPVGERKLPRRDKGNLNEAFLVKRAENIGLEENQWLPETVLPGFRAAVEVWADRMQALAVRLLPLWAVALDLEPNFFEPAFRHPVERLRLTHYPPDATLADAEREGAFGIAPHVDTTFFTLLLQDSPGLTIFSAPRQAWVNVPLVPGAFVVNSGELLRTWSNDRVLSTRHFANNAHHESRYSIPYFFNASSDWPMACLPSCHGPGNPPKYPTISYEQSQAAVQGE